MDEYILRAPKKGDYYKSRLFMAINNIIETDQASYIQKKFSESFSSCPNDANLIQYLMYMYNLEYSTHAEYIIIELRRLLKE